MLDEKLFYSLAKELQELKQKKSNLKEQVGQVHEAILKLEKTFVDVLESYSLSKVSIKGIGTCYIANSPFVKTIDKEKFFNYLRENKSESIIQEYVPVQTIKTYVKEVLETINKVPDGIEYIPNSVVRIRK